MNKKRSSIFACISGTGIGTTQSVGRSVYSKNLEELYQAAKNQYNISENDMMKEGGVTSKIRSSKIDLLLNSDDPYLVNGILVLANSESQAINKFLEQNPSVKETECKIEKLKVIK